MSSSAIYSLRYSIHKNLENYFQGIEKAAFAKAAHIQIDSQIFSLPQVDRLIERCHKYGLKIAVHCPLEEFSVFRRKNFFSRFPICIFFEGRLRDLNLIHSILRDLPDAEFLFVLYGTHRTEFEKVLQIFSQFHYRGLHLSFPPYDPLDETSLSVGEVYRVLKSVRARHPDFNARPLPGFEPFDKRIEADIDLEPLVLSPAFEFGEGVAPKFSIIIPAYNSKFFLVNVVRHLRMQKKPPQDFEIIVVDDGSSDGSKEFLNSYLRSENNQHNIRYFYWPKPVRTENPLFRAGLVRNLGVGHAKGEFLVFLDADILVREDFLSRMAEHLKKYDVVQNVRNHIFPEKSNIHIRYEDVDLLTDTYIEESSYWQPFFESESWEKMSYFWKYTCTYCLAISKENFYKAGRFRRLFTSYGFEDTDLGYRLAKMGCSFYLDKNPTLHLTEKPTYEKSFSSLLLRRKTLSKTAKIFFILNLDPEIYSHFRNFMGGEKNVFIRMNHFFCKFLRRKIRSLKKSFDFFKV